MTKTALWLLCCAILLSACTGTPKTQVKVIKPEIPESLLSCDSAPAYPGADMTQRDVAKWAAGIWYAWQDCRSKLDAIDKISSP